MSDVPSPHLREDFAAVEEGIRATGHSDHGSHVRYEAQAALRRIKEQYEDLKRVNSEIVDVNTEACNKADALQEQLDTVRELNRRAEERCADAFMEARGLKEQLEAMREALAFYADEKTWTQPTSWGGRILDDEGPWLSDTGQRAREALNPATMHPDEADGLEPSETVADPATESALTRPVTSEDRRGVGYQTSSPSCTCRRYRQDCDPLCAVHAPASEPKEDE